MSEALPPTTAPALAGSAPVLQMLGGAAPGCGDDGCDVPARADRHPSVGSSVPVSPSPSTTTPPSQARAAMTGTRRS